MQKILLLISLCMVISACAERKGFQSTVKKHLGDDAKDMHSEEFDSGVANGGLDHDVPGMFDNAFDANDFLDISALPTNKSILSEGGPFGGSVFRDPISVTDDSSGPNDSINDLGRKLTPYRNDFKLECEATLEVNLGPIKPVNARVGGSVLGQFCPTIQHDVHIVFIIDNSGSMGLHYQPKTKRTETGNDPQVKDAEGNPTCGRLDGARAVIEKFMHKKFQSVKSKMSVISFASDVITNKTIKEKSDELATSLINEQVFCETIIQSVMYSQPGGISKPGITSATNYEAPLSAALKLVKDDGDRVLIYFITDGNPNYPNGEENGTKVGIEAARKLIDSNPRITLYALFLKPDNDAQARVLMEKITQDAQLVTLANNSEDIRKKIEEFPDVTFNPKSTKALLKVDPYPDQELKVVIKDHPEKTNIWVYETEPFIYLGRAGETVKNTVEISAEDLNGNEYTAKIIINYQK